MSMIFVPFMAVRVPAAMVPRPLVVFMVPVALVIIPAPGEVVIVRMRPVGSRKRWTLPAARYPAVVVAYRHPVPVRPYKLRCRRGWWHLIPDRRRRYVD